MSPAPHGTQISEAVTPPDQAAPLKALGDVNLAGKGLSFGTPAHGAQVGKFDAQYAVYTLKAADVAITVPHRLGRIPSFVWLMQQEPPANAAGNCYAFIAIVKRDQWTATTFRANVAGNAGTQDGIVLTFIVG